MSREQADWITDIVAACEKIARYADGLSFEQFLAQELVQDAVLRNIEIIEEAAKRLADDSRGRYPAVEWR